MSDAFLDCGYLKEVTTLWQLQGKIMNA